MFYRPSSSRYTVRAVRKGDAVSKYKLHFISFENLDHPGSFSTLMIGKGERPQPWQWHAVRDWLKANEALPVDDGEDLA